MEKIASDHRADISISVVSHGQINMIANLLHDIETTCQILSMELILTLNIDETLPFAINSFSFPVKVIYNAKPLGFAANHNQAFGYAQGRYFCVINPDIRFNSNPLLPLMDCLKNTAVGVAAPAVLNELGAMEDSARHLPTPLKILCKAFGRCKGSDYLVRDVLIAPDWVGGMFMLFRSEVFNKLAGFNERYFLYYEDVDLCARLRLLGYEVILCPQAKVVHHAQRSSHRNFRYLKWHLASMMRFFCSMIFLRVCWQKLTSRCDFLSKDK